MTNTLKKVTKTVFAPEQAAQAAIPYRPAQAAYTSTETERVCRMVTRTVGGSSPGLVKTIVWTGGVPKVQYVQDPGSPGATVSIRVCENVARVVRHPAMPEQKAQPAVAFKPRSVVQEYGLGWNAGARSVGTLIDSGDVTFSVPPSSGVVVGLNDIDSGADYKGIDHALYFSNGIFQVMERGSIVEFGGSYAQNTVFKIERFGSRVRYFAGATLVHTSALPSTGVVFLDVSLYAGGDSIDSPKIERKTGGTLSIAGEFPPMSGILAEGDYSMFGGSFQPFSGGWDALASSFGGSIGPMAGMLTDMDGYGEFTGKVGPFAGGFTAGFLEPAYSVFSGQVFPMQGNLSILSGGLFNAAFFFNPLIGMMADDGYGEFTAEMPPMLGFWQDAATAQTPVSLPKPVLDMRMGAQVDVTAPMGVLNMYAVEVPPTSFALTGPMGALDMLAGAQSAMTGPMGALTFETTTPSLATFDLLGPMGIIDMGATVGILAEFVLTGPMASVYAETGAGIQMSGPMGMLDMGATVTGFAQIAVTGPMGLLGMSATALESVQFDLVGPAPEPGVWADFIMTGPVGRLAFEASIPVELVFEAYAVNLRSDIEGGGNEVTRYTGYTFDRIVRWRGDYYGMAADGLYLLDGDTDDGEPIEWALRTGTTDFGKSQKKNTASGYVGGRLGPSTTFTVLTGEKQENNYPYTTPRGSTAQNYRQKFGRGLDARYYAFQLEGDGELEMDDLDIEVVMRTRRI